MLSSIILNKTPIVVTIMKYSICYKKIKKPYDYRSLNSFPTNECFINISTIFEEILFIII